MVGAGAISPALPTVQAALNIGDESVGLLMTMFTLPGIIFVPITGVLADRYGRKPVIIPALFLFGIAGGLSSLSPDFETLLVMRFLSGIGGGSIGTLTLVLVGDMFRGPDRAAVFGYRIAMGQVGNAAVPLVAGGLAVLAWQFPFLLYFLAVPVGIAAIYIMEPDRPESHSSLKEYFRDIARGLSNRRNASLLTVALSLTIINHGINLVYLPLYIDKSLDGSALVIGVVLMVRQIVGAVFASNMGGLARKISLEWLLIAAFVCQAVSLFWMPFTTSVWTILLPVALGGVTAGIGFPAFQSLLVRGVEQRNLGGVMAANSVVGRIGQTIGPILFGAIIPIGGLTAVFLTAGGLITIVLLFLLIMVSRGVAFRRTDVEE